MPTYRFILRRGPAAAVATDVPMSGELLLDTDSRTVTVGNGAAAGGLPLHKASVGLGNVDNTSDADKPVSTAQAAALALKAPLANPAFTGTPTAPTPTAGDNSNTVATTAFVTAAVVAGGGGGGAAFSIDKTGLEHWWEMPWTRSAHTDGADLTVGSVPALAAGCFPGRFAGNFSNSYLYKASSASVQIGAGSFTVAMWVNHRAFGGDQSYVQKWDCSVPNDEWGCYPSNAGYPTFILCNAANSGNQLLTSTQILTVGRWHHLVFQYDASITQSRIYVDGVLAGSLTISGGVRNSDAKMVVGTWGTTAAGFDAEYLQGMMGDLSIWHRVLTTTEIAALATRNSNRFS